MASYEQSPQDEGYSEDPLTVGPASGATNLPPWLRNMPVPDRTGKLDTAMILRELTDICVQNL